MFSWLCMERQNKPIIDKNKTKIMWSSGIRYLKWTHYSCWKTSLTIHCYCCAVTKPSLTLQPHGLQHARSPWPSPSPGVCPSSCPLCQWCHPTISSSVTLFFFCLQSFPASWSFLMSWLFHKVAKVLELQLQHQSFQWVLRVYFL